LELTGIHHITLVAAGAARSVAFYTRILGLRLVKQTVDYDRPDTWHLYFGDATGTPGTLVSVLVRPDAGRGLPGIGGTHHFALTAETTNAQLKWKRRLTDQGIAVRGPYDRNYFRSIYFRDPDGHILEIATRWPGLAEDELEDALGEMYIEPPEELTRGHRDEAAIAAQTWPEPIPAPGPDMTLSGLHHISAIGSDIGRTTAFWTETLGARLVKRTGNYDDPALPHYYYSLGEAAPGTLITYFAYRPEQMRAAQPGAGLTDHFALTVESDAALDAWHARLRAAGVEVTPVRDQTYFRSFYFRDPDGQRLALVTPSPGFLVDEAESALGQQLQLPPGLELERAAIVAALPPLEPEPGQMSPGSPPSGP
jgi:glyoxalase family protein